MTGGDIVERLEDLVVSVERAAPGGETDDLRALVDVFEGKRVVGLGEATHGTREFFQLKHRLLRLLVTELDFRLFGLEANFTEALAVNRYVVSGEGDPEDALAGITYWTWNTEEMLALIEWLREYNSGRPATERVRFYGYDVQTAQGPARAIRQFFDRVDPDYLAEIDADLATLEGGLPEDDRPAEKQWFIAAETVSAALETRFDRHEGAYRSLVSDPEWRLVRRYRRLLEQACQLAKARTFTDEGDPNAVRDRAMAETVSWILDHENAATIVLWAHNGHVKTGTFRGGEWEEPPHTMGQHLREAFGEDYYALGFEFGRGSFQAYPDPETADEQRVREHTLDSIREGSVSSVLGELDDPPFFVDFESAVGDSTVREWLAQERPLHNIGSIYADDPEDNYVPVALGNAFDGLMFVDETTRAMPLGER